MLYCIIEIPVYFLHWENITQQMLLWPTYNLMSVLHSPLISITSCENLYPDWFTQTILLIARKNLNRQICCQWGALPDYLRHNRKFAIISTCYVWIKLGLSTVTEYLWFWFLLISQIIARNYSNETITLTCRNVSVHYN